MSSFYHLMNGISPCVIFILPMLGKHPNAYPRFRDCFTADRDHPEYDNHIQVYTRTGGGNREAYETENNEIKAMPGYVANWDDMADCTYASWVFRVPERWQVDFNKIMSGNLLEISDEYKAELCRIYPDISAKLDELFCSSEPVESTT